MQDLDIQPRPSAALDIDDDDQLVGRFLSRREVLLLFGAAGTVAAFAACAPGSSSPAASVAASSSASASTAPSTAGSSASAAASGGTAASTIPSCVVIPELTEGPYYVDTNLERPDIRVDTADGTSVEGAPLVLGWLVSQVDGGACIPLEGAIVDVWHCDGEGNYSAVQGETGHDYLRGFQRTDASGAAQFTTIYPGWYQGRAVHIHFKIRIDAGAGTAFEATSQLFFDDALSAEVYKSGIYAAKGTQDQPNESDGIYNQSGGQTLLTVTKDGDTYRTTFPIAVQLG